MFLAEKITALYDLRDAVEEKVRAEVEVERRPSVAAKDALLAATLEVERQTQRTIEVCDTCGRAHRDEPDCRQPDNVREVDFRRERNKGRG